jgi:hypothetical protein
MSGSTNDPLARVRNSVYAVLIAVSLGAMLGRILAVDSVDRLALSQSRLNQVPGELERQREELVANGVGGQQLASELRRKEAALFERAWLQRPFLSANDRSRWCTVRALVEDDMRVPGRPYAIDKVIAEPNWDTIDMVKHDGHLYSSKPPLFPTLLAGEYWVIHRVTELVFGTPLTLGTHPFSVGRFMLVTVNVIPMLIYFVLLARLLERFGLSVWGRTFVMAAAAFGTFLTTFAVVVNNHVPGAVSAMIALYAVIRIWLDGQRGMRYFVLAGLFGAFAAACELPAVGLFALLSLVVLVKAPVRTILGYLPAALVVVAAFFGTNWIAHQSLRPPYMHRSETDANDNWYDYTYEVDGRVVESYWNNRQGLDQGEPSVPTYALHSLVGHHGIFSLTPIWLLSVVGALMWLVAPRELQQRWLSVIILLASGACLYFYIAYVRPVDRNYGGMTSGFRWMFWFAPMWLLLMLPVADAMSRSRWLKGIGLLLLMLSVLSASYPTWNPWTHPWLLNWLHYLRVIQV